MVTVSVGVVANPASGRDVRRLVTGASVFDNAEKGAMVHRLMAGLGAAGVDRVVMMPAGSGVSQSLQRHLSGRTGHLATQRLPELEVLEMALREDARDSAEAVAAMAERRVAAIVVLGGDGTHRVVARHCGDIPLCALSTGTNNAFPELREATVAGLEVGAVVPVGGLVGVLADPSVADADVDAFIAEFQASFVPEEAAEEAEAPTATTEVGGRRLRYLDRGPEAPAGDPVVLLHGFGGDLNNWLFNTDKLAERRRVFALDLPGHGESAKDVGPGDVATFTGVLGGFLDAVGAGRVHLAGHSMGGAVALAFALEHPERAASLTLVAPAGLGEEINADYIDGFVAAERRRELKGVLELLFANQGLVSRTLVDDVLRYKRLDGVQEALATVAAAMYPSGRQTTVLTGELDRLSVPVLVVWGGQDLVLSPAHSDALAGRARVELLAGAGHSPHMEAANEVNRLVGAFLDEQEGEPR